MSIVKMNEVIQKQLRKWAKNVKEKWRLTDEKKNYESDEKTHQQDL